MKRLLIFLLLWAGWGFTAGTLILLGPLRWTIAWSRSQHWSEGEEKARVYVLIILLLFLSFFAARATTRYVLNIQKPRLRFLWFLLPLLGAGLSVFAFLNPTWMPAGNEEVIARQFTVGAYPETDKLKALKEDNFSLVISLLHPAVFPFEPTLMEAEKKAAAEVGLRVAFIPMLPWVSENISALDSLRKLVKTATGKVYIHCYLGRDRVNIARRIIEQEAGTAPVDAQVFHFRRLDTVKQLERGPVYTLDKQVFFTPFPTKEEYAGYVLSADFKQVVSLVNLQEPGARELMEEEKLMLEKMKIPFAVYPVSAATTPEEMEKMATDIKQLPAPKLIHPFSTLSAEAKLFLNAYR